VADGIDRPNQEQLPRLVRRNIADEVYEVLKERILSKQFTPGQRLLPAEIERDMGISRTPLKEAFDRLAAEDLVEIKPRRGVFVADLSATGVAEAYEVRRALEVYAAHQIASRVTESQLDKLRNTISKMRQHTASDDWDRAYQEYVLLDHNFHRLVIEFTGNQLLLNAWHQIDVHAMLASIHYRIPERELTQSQREHEAILAAFEARDTDGAGQAMDNHINRAKQSLLHDISEHQS
jgi:GntR family transcriptional regulator, rspAB operon transcriptional repressor